MLIVSGGLMLAAVTVFLGWNAYLKCRELWRAGKNGRGDWATGRLSAGTQRRGLRPYRSWRALL